MQTGSMGDAGMFSCFKSNPDVTYPISCFSPLLLCRCAISQINVGGGSGLPMDQGTCVWSGSFDVCAVGLKGGSVKFYAAGVDSIPLDTGDTCMLCSCSIGGQLINCTPVPQSTCDKSMAAN